MKSRTPWIVLSGVATLVVLAAGAALADAPKVSTFAPAKDLERQVSLYLGRLEESVQSADDYKDAEGRVTKDANTMILIALALGLHDTDNQYKAAAPAMIKAAQELAKAKDYASAKAGVEALKKATESKGDPSTLKWEKIASLPELMKQVPLINTRLKRNTRAANLAKKKAKESAAGDAAVLAVIAQGSMADTSPAKDDEAKVKQWTKFCEEMRDVSAAINKEIAAGKSEEIQSQIKVLTKNCDDCHEVFSPDAKKKAAEASQK